MPEYKVYALKYAGPFRSSGALLMWLKEWEESVERDYYIWCVKGENRTILVDAGVAPALAGERELPGYVSPGEVVERIGIKADEVRDVILTHLHWDHANGAGLFPNARFYVQREEYAFWMKDPLARRSPFDIFLDEGTRRMLGDLAEANRLVFIEGDREIFPGVECLLAPGHSVALQAVAVDTPKGKAVLGSDCAHTFRNYREYRPSAIFIDLAAWVRTCDKLHAKVQDETLIFPGHDPLMTRDYPRVAEGVSLLA